MNGQGGGGFNLANRFRVSGGAPNDAAVRNDAARGTGVASEGDIDPATGKTKQKMVPGTGMPNDMANPGADPNNVTGPNNLGGNKGSEQGSPLDGFADIFKIDPNAAPQQDPLSQKLLELDPKKLGESVSKMDFTRNLNQELVQKALQGDSQAFGQVLNSAFQGAFAASTQMMVGLMKQAITKNNGRFNSVLEGRFRDFQINSSNSNNKVLNHPSVKPVLAAIRQQIANSPVGKNLSASEIQQKAEEYFMATADALTSLKTELGDKDKAKGGGGGQDYDFSMFLSDGNSQQ